MQQPQQPAAPQQAQQQQQPQAPPQQQPQQAQQAVKMSAMEQLNQYKLQLETDLVRVEAQVRSRSPANTPRGHRQRCRATATSLLLAPQGPLFCCDTGGLTFQPHEPGWLQKRETAGRRNNPA
jgi:hypothetical protein